MLCESTRMDRRGWDVGAVWFLFGVVVWLCVVCFGQTTNGDVAWFGDLDPTNPTTWFTTTNVYIGKDSSGTLNITDGSDVINRQGYIGYNSGSAGEVMVDGPGSTWTNNGGLFIGHEGRGVLDITDSGYVKCSTSYIGYLAGSTGNVSVDGAGSRWNSSQDLYLGYSGNATLDISNGSEVDNKIGYIGYDSGSMGVVTVDGAGSTWNNNHYIYVGRYGSGKLHITNGGKGTAGSDCDIGYGPGSVGAVLVDGTGSNWTNAGSLSIGRNGSGTLDIINGGEVRNDNSSYIGFLPGATGTATVAGIGSKWVNNGELSVGDRGNGILNITNGGSVTVEKNTWVAKDNGSTSSINFDYGSLTTGGLCCGFDDLTGVGTIHTSGLVSDVDLVFDASHGLNQSLNFADNSSKDITVYLNVDGSGMMGAGYDGVGKMSISDGIIIESRSGYIGYHSGSTGEVAVDGVGSTWNNSDYIYVGRYGSGKLDITNGGKVHASSHSYIGSESGSTGTVTVEGVGSTLTNGDDLYVGQSGSGTLNIIGGGSVNSESDTFVAYQPGSSGTIHFDNGTLTTRSLLCAPDDLTGIGTIHTSGLVSDVDLVFDASHGLNQILNFSDNSSKDIAVYLNVDGSGMMGAGYKGVGTTSISDGRVIESSSGYIGCHSGSTGEVSVDGAGSTWNSSGEICVGRYGSGELDITNGGEVNASGHCCIGSESGSMGTVTVDGAGSMLLSSWPWLKVGDKGSGTLNITNGGAVNSSYSHIGGSYGSLGEVTIQGVGSTWTTTNGCYIGDSGSGRLSITEGGEFSNNNKDNYIGHQSGSTGEVTVDGSGSKWTTTRYFYVGYNGSGKLNITDGGIVSNASKTYIGKESGSTGTVTVEGAGSTLTIGDDLYVGQSGSGTLDICSGGAVNSESNTFVAFQPGSSGAIHFDNGSLTTRSLLCASNDITGVGTIHTNGLVSDVDLVFNATYGLNQILNLTDSSGKDLTVYLNVFNSGSFSSYGKMGAGYRSGGTISISDGRVIKSSGGYIGYHAGSTGEVSIDGAGSTWDTEICVGLYGNGKLDITNGGGVNASGDCFIGKEFGSAGTVAVEGTGSMLLSQWRLCVGLYGSGTLNITSGGTVNSYECSIGGPRYYSGIDISPGSIGEVTVAGTGSTWTNDSYLIVGGIGNGKLIVTDGGMLMSCTEWDHVGQAYTAIGNNSLNHDSLGEVVVNGIGSTWTNGGDIYIGYYSSGMLSILNGGKVHNHVGLIGYEHGSTGTVTVDGTGSTWTSGGISVGSRSGDRCSGNGTLNITNGGLVVSTYLGIDNTHDGNSFVNMSTGGMLALYGDGDDSLVDFLDMVWGTDAIRYWDYSISDWADITGAAYGEDYTLSYLVGGDLDGYTVLCVGAPEPGVAGDANHDGVVDETDAVVMARYWLTKSGAGWEMGDFNGDGAVDEVDATILAANWQCGVDEVVPEPSAICGLLGIILLGVLGWGRFGRSE